MHLTSALATLSAILLTATAASARISHIVVPQQAMPGENITVTVTSHSYIQNWDDFGIIFGLKPDTYDCETCLGQEIGYEDLYHKYNLGNTTYSVHLPNTTIGSYTFVAAVPYLVGASGETGINYFNQSISLVSSAKMTV
ncbi:hypothetical protein IAU60_002091 [Kwoniella sp. DSM 27419]